MIFRGTSVCYRLSIEERAYPVEQLFLSKFRGKSTMDGLLQPRFTLRQLAYFAAAAELSSTTQAAARFVMTQSAMSAALTDLEHAVGTQLLVRYRGRGLELTASGRAFLPEVRRLLQAAEDLQGLTGVLNNELAGRLFVGCFDAMSPALLPPLMAEMTRLYPDLHLDPISETQNDIVRALTEGRVEIALLFDIDVPPNLSKEFLYQPTPHALLPVAHRLATETTVSIYDLQTEPLILLTTPPAPRIVHSALRATGLALNPHYELGNFDLIRALVDRGLGYSLLTQPIGASPAHWNNSVRAVPIRDELATPPVVLAQVQGIRPTRRSQAFRDVCTRTVSSLAWA
ncbi:LysR substrate-binding domain-containing protein [Skermania pinensis]|uniref:LysR substrate-binding domain-containing protein n=1 Tax=Skermania pinensis TaxID=39122 RepID=UPI0014704F6A|nr:LysR substrate-binding domain-containing protein [Skermania piniformis]